LIAGSACVVLYRSAHNIEFDKIIVALRAKTVSDAVIAGIFVVASYTALTFYDFFALRTIGRDQVPYRIAALAGFASYTVGHNIGAMVLTGGLIRLRIYSLWGLEVVDVAKIAFVTGLTFWLGNAFTLGCALLYSPGAAGAIDLLPAPLNQALGLLALMSIVGYLAWLMPQPRAIGTANWKIRLPCWRLTLVQIAIGIGELCFAALAMYSLLPSSPAIDLPSFLVVFVLAMLLGFLSHTPGSLGVVEAMMLVGLPQFPKEELIASLLAFRGFYFLLPLCVGGLCLLMYEAWLMLRPVLNNSEFR
jgi:uncharacterized membrane protein YbhN (UPF0104 family)